jgi:hypothetical protein
MTTSPRKRKSQRSRRRSQPKLGNGHVPAYATAKLFDGGMIQIEILIQPEDAARFADQIVNTIVRNGGES